MTATEPTPQVSIMPKSSDVAPTTDAQIVPTAPTNEGNGKRGRKPRRENVPVTEKRLKAMYIWVDDQVNKICKGFEESDRVIYGAGVIALLQLDTDKQFELIKNVKLQQAKLSQDS
jgi:hypothetical protein